ncbi:MAG: SBBP repeat-containing protein [Crocinitomicaceae bacterium]|nr:SBBP repeat-containing protein [Crocinitomicaceae bacterium]
MKALISILISLFAVQFAISQISNEHPSFIKNEGQMIDQNGNSNSDVLFLMPNSQGMNTQLRKTGFSYDIYSSNRSGKMEFNRIDIDFVGSNSDFEVIQSDKQTSKFNYYLAGKSATAISNVEHFNTVKYKNVYPNIDIVFTVQEAFNAVKYDIVLHPGADINDVQFKYSGFDNISLETTNTLELSTHLRVLHESIPLSYYQENDNEVDVNFKALRQTSSSILVGFALETPLIQTQTLVIDPIPSFSWGRYIGDSLSTQTRGVITDRFGFVYICGSTQSLTNIATVGAYQSVVSDSINDAYLMKYNNYGNVIWSTYFGGDANDIGNDVYVDTSFNVFLAGTTHSTAGLVDGVGSSQATLGGNSDAFIAKFNETGMLLWSSYFGGDSLDIGTKLSTDFDENVYLAGSTRSFDSIASVSSSQPLLAGESDGFVVKYDSSGVVQWSTYIGGAENDFATGISFGDTSVFVSGQTYSADFPVTDSMYQDSLKGLSDGFLAKLTKDGDLVWATYYGGENDDNIRNVKTFNNNVYFIGSTDSDSSISTTGAFQAFKSDSTDAFIGEMDNAGQVQWSSYFGGDSLELGIDLFFELDSNIIIFGSTNSTNIPFVDTNSYQPSLSGETDTYIAKISQYGNMMWSTYYGGELSETAEAVAVFGNTAIYVVGSTYSDSIIIPQNNIWGTNVYNSDQEGYFTKFRQATSTIGQCMGSGGGPNIWHCPGEEIILTILGGELGTDADWIWYEGQCGNSAVIGTGDTLIVYPTVTTTYYVRAESITNASLCMSVTINVHPTSMFEIVSDSTACPGSDFALSSNGTGTFNWNGPNSFASNASDTTLVGVTDSLAGWYYMTATDSIGCVYEDSVDLEVFLPPGVTDSVVHVSCFGYNDGAIFLTPDTVGYAYDWVFVGPPSDTIIGQDSLTNIYAGTYALTVTDSNNCTLQDSIIVDQPPSALLDTLIFPTACNDSTGAIFLTINQTIPYTATWSPTPHFGDSATALNSDFYSVTIERENLCVEHHSFFVPMMNSLSVSIDSVVPILCAGTATGSATALASSGIEPYTYEWPVINQQGNLATDLDTGTYIVVVYDDAGCTTSDTITLTSVSSLELNESVQPSLCSENTGSINLNVNDPGSIQTILFSNGESQNLYINNLPAGTYSVSITDTVGCQYDFDYIVDVINDLQVETNPGDTILEMGSTTQLEVVTNSDGSFYYEWTPTDFLSCGSCSNPTITPMGAGSYQVIVTDSMGCTDTTWLNIDISIPCLDVFIPNMFSPNGDQLNDKWNIIGSCLSSTHARVYNQWGALIFESFDQSIGWDGTYRGVRVPNDQYTYIVDVVYGGGTGEKFAGFLTVVD